jgi:hypothetical protein
MKIKKYLQYLKESDDIQDAPEVQNSSEIESELKDLIEKTIDNNNQEFDEFVNSFIKYPNETRIEGLIDESDIYEFYLKYRNEIDEILNEVNFFESIPSDLAVFSLYEYIIKGTQRTIEEVVKKFK